MCSNEKPSKFTKSLILSLLIISIVLVGFSTPAAAADPSISSVTISDPSLTGTENAEVDVSGTVETGVFYDHRIVFYEKSPIYAGGRTPIFSESFTPSSSDFDFSHEFEVPNDENGEDHEYQVKLVQDNTSPFGGSTSVKSDEINKFVTAPDSEDPDPQIIDTDERMAPDTYIYYHAEDFSESGAYDINNPPTIHPGERVDINFNVRNDGGTAGEFSTLQMQFPSFDEDTDRSKFDIFSGGFEQNQFYIAPDDTVYDQDGDPHRDGASSWQFERSLDFVQPDSEHGFTAEVTPEEPGEFRVLMRATYTDDTAQTGGSNQESTRGSVSDPDQNGYQMKEVVFDVEPRNEAPNADAGGSYDVGESDSITLDASGSEDPDGNIASESWEVISGDGFVSDGSYNAPNNIPRDQSATVELTVEDNDGATDTATATINIHDNQAPTAEANAPNRVDEGDSVQLDSSRSSDSDGEITSESWVVTSGPGSISGSTYRAPSGITQNRDATVELTVTDDDGASATATARITISDDTSNNDPDGDGIPNSRDEAPNRAEDEDGYQDNDGVPENPAPSVSIGDTSVSEGQSTTITASGTDPEGDSLDYEWSSPAEGTIRGSGSSVTYEAPSGLSSDSSVTLSVTVYEDDERKSADATARITISDDTSNNDPDGDGIPNSRDEAPNRAEDEDGYQDNDGVPENPAPSVSIGDTSVSEGQSTTITASGTDPEGESLDYVWSSPDEGNIRGSGDSISYEAPNRLSSDTSVTLEVTVYEDDDRKSADDTATVEITDNNQPPTAEANGPYTVGEGSSVQLDSSGSSDSDGEITSESWSVTSGPGSISGSTYQAPSDITQNREAEVKLTVTDDDGASTTATATVEITYDNQPPTAEANGPYTVGEGSSVQLDSSGSSDSDGEITSESWSVTNGPGSISGSTYQAPSDITQSRDAEVELTVTDDDGASTTATATVEIETNSAENRDPTADNITLETDQGVAIENTFDATDPDGDTLSYSIITPPSNGEVTTSGDSFEYTPSAEYAGTDSFEYRVTDGNGGQNSATVTIEIQESNSRIPSDFPDSITDEQYSAVAGDDGELSQLELSNSINEWFTSNQNTINGVEFSQTELSQLINYWYQQNN